MPDLTPLFALGRFAVIAYATVATVLATACLTLQAMTVFDRRLARNAAPRRASQRPLFVRLGTESTLGAE